MFFCMWPSLEQANLNATTHKIVCRLLMSKRFWSNTFQSRFLSTRSWFSPANFGMSLLHVYLLRLHRRLAHVALPLLQLFDQSIFWWIFHRTYQTNVNIMRLPLWSKDTERPFLLKESQHFIKVDIISQLTAANHSQFLGTSWISISCYWFFISRQWFMHLGGAEVSRSLWNCDWVTVTIVIWVNAKQVLMGYWRVNEKINFQVSWN